MLSASSASRFSSVPLGQIMQARRDSRSSDWNTISELMDLEARCTAREMQGHWTRVISSGNPGPLVMTAYANFEHRQGRPDLALGTLRGILSKERFPEAITAAIAAAADLSQDHLVLDYFALYKTDERRVQPEEILTLVANCALRRREYQLAEAVFVALRDRKGGTDLPDLESALIREFGEEKVMRKWGHTMADKAATSSGRKSASVSDWVMYGSFLIWQARYKEALKLLETVRQERFPETG